MAQLRSFEDTIVAISTPNGQGGIGIVRLSGPQALSIADGMFASKGGKKPSQYTSHSVHYGWIVQQTGEVIDEVMLTVMRAPKSYTTEDVVEISCHGGFASVKAILTLAIEWGARLAEPGEFTKRAFIHGRIDLAQAEAVLDIIQAKTDAFLRVSTHQLKGELSVELESIRDALINIYTELEAVLNFPEDDIDAESRQEISARLDQQHQRVERLARSGQQGRILKEGIRIVICGKPNVGKSSLLNSLLKQPRAIVTDIAGTTRDVIEETAQIQGIPFQLIDTAGFLDPRDIIEEEAIRRSHMSIEHADLILFILDASRPLERQDKELMEKIKDRRVLALLNKCDLPLKIEEDTIKGLLGDKKILKISALQKIAIDQLEEVIVREALNGASVDAHGVLVSNVRHLEALLRCQEALLKAVQLMRQGHSLEFVSEEIKAAVNFLDNITGKNVDEDLLDRIFSSFCIGK